MARTIETIYNEIVAEKDAQTTLEGLAPLADNYDELLSEVNSDSKVAIWRLWAFVTAVAIHAHELLWDIFKTEIEELAATAPAGTLGWYQKEILEFQYGDSLEWNGTNYVYSIIDTTKQIIKRCAVQERSDGVVVVKVAKEDSGNLTPLLTVEKDALSSYANKIKFAGTRLGIITLEADVIDIVFEIFYDPIEPLTDVQNAVQIAIDGYLEIIDFNGQFRVTDCIDKIQLVEGVKDVKLTSANGTPSGQTLVSFDRVYVPLAGYMTFADTAENMFTWTVEL